jgi:antagonist of KipI
MSALVVERPGLLTTIQDAGRWGWQHLGVPVSGWMDDWSAALANRLAGNDEDAAALEITLIGPTLRALGPVVIAVTGAVFDVTVGRRRFRSPFVTTAHDGDTIAFATRSLGTRAYLACQGGLDVALVLGSASTDVRAGLGGRRLQARDTIAVRAAVPRNGETREFDPPAWLFEPVLHVLPGPDDGRWTDDALDVLAREAYVVTSASDRTGYRLDGPSLPAPGGELISGPVATGTLQVPPSGHPILLMADCQTTGGYARLGALPGADRAVAAQLGPGDRCVFERCTLAEAASSADIRRRVLDAVVESAQ